MDNSPVVGAIPGNPHIDDDDDAPMLIGGSRSGAIPSSPTRGQTWGEIEVEESVEAGLEQSPAWKREVYEKTLEFIMNEAVFTFTLVRQEVDWFFWKLGLDDFYFKSADYRVIAGHIQSIYAAKVLAAVSGSPFDIKLRQESEEGGFYCCRSMHSFAVKTERRIEEAFLGEGYTSNQVSISKGIVPGPAYDAMRMAAYRTKGAIGSGTKKHLRVYFLQPPQYEGPEPSPKDEVDIERVGCVDFLKAATAYTKQMYQDVLRVAAKQVGPVVRTYDAGDEVRLVICYRRGGTHSFLSGTSDVLRSLDLYSTRKYIEQFRNGYVVYSIYLRTYEAKTVIDRERLVECVHLVYALPRTSLSPLFQDGTLTIEQMSYAYCAWKFSQFFQQNEAQDYLTLINAVKEDYPDLMPSVLRLRERVQGGTSQGGGRMRETIVNHKQILLRLYADFEAGHSKKRPRSGSIESLDDRRQKISHMIKRNARTEYDQSVFQSFLIFNQHILKTNFFALDKVCLSFRLNPKFLANLYYSVIPFGIFFMVGSEFRGFHVRFRDVARGGIRIIRSPNQQAFVNNCTSLFTENYNLAYTQQNKNKDIPEGGSKGTILLDLDHQTKAEMAFKKYVDGLLQLILPGPDIVDHYGKEEIIFLGPDEGTADLMDWASAYARHRGAEFWKGFTTGKATSMGGIPHDMYGMTTRSVHQYVLGIYRKLNIDETTVTKFQTGGPDGDLGSNEIKISSDKTVAVVDGSGVLYDPLGIDRPELTRLAKARLPCINFDASKLSSDGFLVSVDATDVVLPDGTKVERGLIFRNEFHLSKYASADLFVPCGGRPNAVNGNNIAALLTPAPRFKYIVEGANLFFADDARQQLAAHGVLLFKDASANKGGVTSSSLEVLASLALTDEEYKKHMCVTEDGTIPDFRKEYVQEVIDRIETNARREFEVLWEEHTRSQRPLHDLTDELSVKINNIRDGIGRSKLWFNTLLRRDVLERAIPKTLQELIGLPAVSERLPELYTRAIFNAYLASSYVYSCGLAAAEFEFLEFITSQFRTQA